MKLAIFDFNGTIFPRETLTFLLQQWYHHKYPRRKLIASLTSLLPLFARYKIQTRTGEDRRRMEIEAVRRFANIFTGMSREQIGEFFSLAAISAEQYFNQQIIERIAASKKNNYHTVLLSGAFLPLLVEIGNKLNFDTIIGSELSYNGDIFDPEYQPKIISGPAKLDKLKQVFGDQKIDWEDSCAYADSGHDLFLLEAVGKPYPVDPDEQLELLAKEKEWEIIYSKY
ncbi:MAG: HAD family hydrolase [Halanaerobium sp.]|nr:HAD family hydrolase [Halanaerobium sp.]